MNANKMGSFQNLNIPISLVPAQNKTLALICISLKAAFQLLETSCNLNVSIAQTCLHDQSITWFQASQVLWTCWQQRNARGVELMGQSKNVRTAGTHAGVQYSTAIVNAKKTIGEPTGLVVENGVCSVAAVQQLLEVLDVLY